MGKPRAGNLTFFRPFLGSSARTRGVLETFPRSLGRDPEHLVFLAGIAQLVEHHLAKVGVAGSSPVSRFEEGWARHTGRAAPLFFRRRSQAVRQRPAKPLFPGSNPGGASQGWSPPCCRRPGSNRSVRAEAEKYPPRCGPPAHRRDDRGLPKATAGQPRST